MSRRMPDFRFAALASLLSALAVRAQGEVKVSVVAGPQPLAAGGHCILQVEHLEDDRGCWRRLWERWTSPWRWTVREGDRPLDAGTAGLIRDLGGGRFQYTVPRMDRPHTFVLRATSRFSPHPWGEAMLQVAPPGPLAIPGMPKGIMAIIAGYVPDAAAAPQAGHLPFLDPAAGARFWPAEVQPQASRGTMVHDWRHRISWPAIMTGYGLPLRLKWPREPRAAGHLLSWQSLYEGGTAGGRLLEFKGADSGAELALSEDVESCTLETLYAPAEAADAWASVTRQQKILVRGLLPLAGNPVADPDPWGQDGAGVSARFGEPLGLDLVMGDDDQYLLVVADPQQHVLRSVEDSNRVTTPWGRPGVPGHRDGVLDQALFNGPTYLSCRKTRVAEGGPGLETTAGFVVSDSGNHAIRQIGAGGKVTTLAGAPLAGPGHLDHPKPSLARFNNPQGIAVDLDGNVFVADQGNCVIRKISARGAVTTLAGLAGHPGSEDGMGSEARFLRLKGLAVDHGDDCLYVTDGHAIRRVSLAGLVQTLRGSVAQAGFQDCLDPSAPQRVLPCFNDPHGIVRVGNCLHVADTGNHAIREYALGTSAVRTLAGDPGRAAIRWGLLRDGLEAFPGEGYGTLLAPRGITGHRCQSGESVLYLSTGPCLATIPSATQPELARPGVRLRPLAPLAIGETYLVAFTVPDHRAGLGLSSAFDFEYEVSFLDPDGTPVGTPVRGRGGFSDEQRFPGCPFTQRGLATVRVRCVTLDGLSGGAEVAVPVR